MSTTHSLPTSLNQALATLRRRYGDAVITPADAVPADPLWATGVPAIDSRLTPGGLPRGRVSVLAAASAKPSGRLTLLQALVATASREGVVAYLDLAGTLDPGFLADLGADLDSVLVVRPPSERWEDGLAMARTLVRAGAGWLGVAMGARSPRAAAWEHRLSALAEAVSARGAVCVVSAPAPLPVPLAYASSLSLRCDAVSWQESHGDIVGLRTRVTTVKSKVGAPGAEAVLLLRYPRTFAHAEILSLPAVVEVSMQVPREAPSVISQAG